MHLRYLLESQPERRGEIHGYLEYAEAQLNNGAAVSLD